MNIFGVAHYVVAMLKRFVPRMKSVSRCERFGAVHRILPCSGFHFEGTHLFLEGSGGERQDSRV
jgi:hypothetical protein